MTKITVRLTVAQWNALVSCATGELESLTEHDWKAGVGDDLLDAVRVMKAARKAAAKR